MPQLQQWCKMLDRPEMTLPQCGDLPSVTFEAHDGWLTILRGPDKLELERIAARPPLGDVHRKRIFRVID